MPGTRKYTNGHQRFCASIFFTPTNIDEIMTIIKELKNQKLSGLNGFSSFLIKSVKHIHIYTYTHIHI